MRKVRITWVILGPEPHLATCERCGGHEAKPDLPVPVDAALAYFKYVVEKHRFCRPAQEVPAL